MFVFSPSNMSTYRTCPRKFQAQTITKELPWQATAQKSRGTLVHKVVEMALRSGLDAVTSWPEGADPDYTRNSVAEARAAAGSGGGRFPGGKGIPPLRFLLQIALRFSPCLPLGGRWPRRAGGREPCHGPKCFG